MKISRYLLFFVVSYTLLFLSFAPVVWIESAYHDDVNFFANGAAKSSCFNDPGYSFNYVLDRPGAAWFDCEVFTHAHRLNDLSKMRSLVIGFMASAASFLTLILVTYGFSEIAALLLSITIFTLPGIQFAAFMTSFPLSVTLNLSLIAFYMLTRVRICSPRRWRFQETILFTLSFVLLIIAGCTYPALGFAFFWGCLARALTKNSIFLRDQIKLLVRDIVFFGCAMLCALLIAFYISPGWLNRISKPVNYTIDLNIASLFSRLPSLLDSVFFFTANLWYYAGGIRGAIVAMLVLLTATIVALWPRRGEIQKSIILFWRILIAMVICLITFTPSIVAIQPMLLEREVVPPMGALVVVSVILCSLAFERLLPSQRKIGGYVKLTLASFLAITGLIASSYETTKNVWNTNTEIMFVRTELARYDAPPRLIHVIRPDDVGLGYDNLPKSGDEFNGNTANYFGDIVDFMQLSMLSSSTTKQLKVVECDPMTSNCQIFAPPPLVILSVSNYGQPFCRLPNMVLIDFNILLRASGVASPKITQMDRVPLCTTDQFTVSSSFGYQNHEINEAFRGPGDLDNFWEAPLTQPVLADIRYRQPIVLSSYGFAAGSDTDGTNARMPLDWTLYGSVDGNTWQILDIQKNQKRWIPFESRTFPLKLSRPLSYFRLVITGSGEFGILRIYRIILNPAD